MRRTLCRVLPLLLCLLAMLAAAAALGAGTAAAPDARLARLADLHDALARAKTAGELQAALTTLAPALGFTFGVESTDMPTRPRQTFTLAFDPPLPARDFCRAMGWTRAYATAGDTHQEGWSIVLGGAERADAGGPRLEVHWPRVGNWAVEPRLVERPAGDLPHLSSVASPAYDVESHPARVTRVVVQPWTRTWHR
jgi:hypothetical protein